ncbi:MAG: hypothetical protein FRX48_08792 [Lasallia pustulata]|uniref:DUF7730 domain-containing protein n=1 Tax=Lasallia pustulata TaxID=136370 RepID=A0A5M8PDX7_9LECA|nr:MAG: hypothetical protein FRX48_08792 [Lasallia pustulata]
MTAEEEKRACGTSTLAITATCRLIYLEAIDLYYANHIFKCCVITWLPDFLDSFGTANINIISEIRYHGHAGAELYTLEQMPGLRTLKVVLGFYCSECEGHHHQIRRRECEWFGGAGHPNITDLENEISAMNEYLKQI